jgi:hypothetical protein
MPPTDLMPPHLAIVAPPSILDSPRWQWVAEARAAAHEDDLRYSTFAPGAEPDVWPALPELTPMAGRAIALLAAWLVVALGLWRWQRGRVRIT